MNYSQVLTIIIRYKIRSISKFDFINSVLFKPVSILTCLRLVYAGIGGQTGAIPTNQITFHMFPIVRINPFNMSTLQVFIEWYTI